MSKLYIFFSKDYKDFLDYSEENKLELFLSESYGDVLCKHNNGYYWGKKWLNVNVAMWKEDINKGLLTKIELFEDPLIPNEWLHQIFNHSKEYKERKAIEELKLSLLMIKKQKHI
jgi:hypothetical protein